MNQVERQTIVAQAKALETEAIVRVQNAERQAENNAQPYPRDILSAIATHTMLRDAGLPSDVCYGKVSVLIVAANPGQSDPQTEMKWVSTGQHHHWVETLDDLIDLRPLERDIVEAVLPPEGRTTFDVPMFWFDKAEGETIYGAAWTKEGTIPADALGTHVAMIEQIRNEMGGTIDDHELPEIPALVISPDQYDQDGSDYWLRVNAVAQLKRP